VVRRWCISGVEMLQVVQVAGACAQVHMFTAGSQMHRNRGAQVLRCRGTEVVQRCRGGGAQVCRGADGVHSYFGAQRC